jgi:hypothetical protein
MTFVATATNSGLSSAPLDDVLSFDDSIDHGPMVFAVRIIKNLDSVNNIYLSCSCSFTVR